jgi:hypothetical protein
MAVGIEFGPREARELLEPSVRVAQQAAAARVRARQTDEAPQPESRAQHTFGGTPRSTQPPPTFANGGRATPRASDVRASDFVALRVAARADAATDARIALARRAPATTGADDGAFASARAADARPPARTNAWAAEPADADAAEGAHPPSARDAAHAALSARGRAKMVEDLQRAERARADEARDAHVRVSIRQLERKLAAHARRLARERIAARARTDADANAAPLAAERAELAAAHAGLSPERRWLRARAHMLTHSAIGRGETEHPVSAACAGGVAAEAALALLDQQADEVAARARRLALAREAARAHELLGGAREAARAHELLGGARAGGAAARDWTLGGGGGGAARQVEVGDGGGGGGGCEDGGCDSYGYRLSQLSVAGAAVALDATHARAAAAASAVDAASLIAQPPGSPRSLAGLGVPTRRLASSRLDALFESLDEYAQLDAHARARTAGARARGDGGADRARWPAAEWGANPPRPKAVARAQGANDAADAADAAARALALAQAALCDLHGTSDRAAQTWSRDGARPPPQPRPQPQPHDDRADADRVDADGAAAAALASARRAAANVRRLHAAHAAVEVGGGRASRLASAPPARRGATSTGASARAPPTGALHSAARQFVVRTPVRAVVGGAADAARARVAAAAPTAAAARAAVAAAALEAASTVVQPPGSPRLRVPFGATAPRATPSGHMAHQLVIVRAHAAVAEPARADGQGGARAARPASAGGVRQAALPADWGRRDGRRAACACAPAGDTAAAAAAAAAGSPPRRVGCVALCCGPPADGFCCRRHHPDPLVVCCEVHDPLTLFRILASAKRPDDGRARGPRGYKEPRNLSAGPPNHTFTTGRQLDTTATTGGRGRVAADGGARMAPVALRPSDCYPAARAV